MTCRDATARPVPNPGDTLKPFHKPAE